jgi:hypothetical protein
VTVIDAVSAPAREGVKTTPIAQFAPTATELPQVSPVSAKSLPLAPPIARLVILKAAVPVLLKVTV